MSSVKYTRKIDSPDAFHIDPVIGVDKVTFSRKLSRKEKVLIAALLLALAVAVAFIVLYVLQVSKSNNEVGSSSTHTTTSTYTTRATSPTSACLPADCVLVASG